MMPWVKRLVYEMGFRPKPYSIFFSPSGDWIYGYRDYIKQVNEQNKKADK